MMRTPASAGAVGIIDRASDRVAAAAAMPSEAAADHAFLFTPAADRSKNRIPLAIVLLSLLIFLAVVPFARMRLPHAWAIVPSYESALVVNDLITAVLLFAQFAILRSRALLALACGYLFAALMIVPHTLTFPGLLRPDGLLGSAPQSTAWLYLFWHAGLPPVVIAYALLQPETGAKTGAKTLAQASVRPPCSRRSRRRRYRRALTLLATAGQASLHSCGTIAPPPCRRGATVQCRASRAHCLVDAAARSMLICS